MNKNLIFTQCLTAKFCHEMSGVIGAIDNGIELLEESEGEMKEHSQNLISLSSKQAVGRLLFYRQAYGIAKNTNDDQLESFTDIINKYFYGSKITFEFDSNNPAVLFCPIAIKIFLSLLIQAAGNLLVGGKISVSTTENTNNKEIKILLQGTKIKTEDEKITLITENQEIHEVTVNNVNIAYIQKLKNEINADIENLSTDTMMTYSIKIYRS